MNNLLERLRQEREEREHVYQQSVKKEEAPVLKNALKPPVKESKRVYQKDLTYDYDGKPITMKMT